MSGRQVIAATEVGSHTGNRPQERGDLNLRDGNTNPWRNRESENRPSLPTTSRTPGGAREWRRRATSVDGQPVHG